MDSWEFWASAIGLFLGFAAVLMLQSLRRGMNAMQLQGEAWIRIHNSQQQMIELMQELRSDMAVMRRRTNDTMDTLFHGLEARKHLGMVSNTHDMVMELHGRRANLAEVQHVSYLRARLEDLTQQVMQLRDQQGATSVQGGQLPIVRLAVPDGSELQLL